MRLKYFESNLPYPTCGRRVRLRVYTESLSLENHADSKRPLPRRERAKKYAGESREKNKIKEKTFTQKPSLQ
jgi:hypothetical protein